MLNEQLVLLLLGHCDILVRGEAYRPNIEFDVRSGIFLIVDAIQVSYLT